MRAVHIARLGLALGLALLASPAIAKTPVPKATLVPVTPASHPFGNGFFHCCFHAIVALGLGWLAGLQMPWIR